MNKNRGVLQLIADLAIYALFAGIVFGGLYVLANVVANQVK